jgi:hypothetical protein
MDAGEWIPHMYRILSIAYAVEIILLRYNLSSLLLSFSQNLKVFLATPLYFPLARFSL